MAAGYDDSEQQEKCSSGTVQNGTVRHRIEMALAGRVFRRRSGALGEVPSNPVLAQIMFERSLTEPHGAPVLKQGACACKVGSGSPHVPEPRLLTGEKVGKRRA